jgi:hypothetical protein
MVPSASAAAIVEQRLISYDRAGRPVESVADYLIKPSAGSSNPFLPAADRTTTKRDYALEVVDESPPANQKTGMNVTGETRDTVRS